MSIYNIHTLYNIYLCIYIYIYRCFEMNEPYCACAVFFWINRSTKRQPFLQVTQVETRKDDEGDNQGALGILRCTTWTQVWCVFSWDASLASLGSAPFLLGIWALIWLVSGFILNHKSPDFYHPLIIGCSFFAAEMGMNTNQHRIMGEFIKWSPLVMSE